MLHVDIVVHGEPMAFYLSEPRWPLYADDTEIGRDLIPTSVDGPGLVPISMQFMYSYTWLTIIYQVVLA